LHQVLAVERVLAIHRPRVVVDAPEELGGHDVVEARPLELAERLTHHGLALAARVDLGVVEEVHARVEGRSHHLARRGDVDLIVIGHPGAERQRAELKAAASHASIEHSVHSRLVGVPRMRSS